MLSFRKTPSQDNLSSDQILSLNDFDIANSKLIREEKFVLSENYKLIANKTLKASLKKEFPSSQYENCFEDNNQFFISLRKGVFRAQVDHAMSKVYKLFLPHLPDTLLVKDDEGNDYVASRAIKNLQGVKDEITNIQSQIYGFGTILCLDYIFGDADLYENYGFQKHNERYVAFKYDNEYFFDEEMLSENLPTSMTEIESKILSMVDLSFVKFISRDEIFETIRLIFEKKEEIKKIIISTIRSSSIQEGYWGMQKVLQALEDNPQDQGLQSLNASFHKQLLEYAEKETGYNATTIISKLQIRFKELEKAYNKNSIFISMFKY